MTAEFAGKWNLVTSENFDAYMKEVGVGLVSRTIGAKLKPVLTITVEGEQWSITTTSTFSTHVFKFELGKEFTDKTIDGREVTCKFFVDGNKLVQEEKGKNGKDSRFERYLEDGKLKITCECNGVKSTRIYERAAA